ncbi:MAG: UDP-N-acetylmuramate--L-alanine ligase, partial [Candidatus Latescibacterota bacterium]|nr:UDP-N-acetylmuramate--L-alanine ligase [Candidatus Latescibacterota bacterium]
ARGTDRRVVAVFQPHLYSRTQHLLDDFADALSLADEVTVCEIYAAREASIAGVTSSLLTDALRERGVVARDESHPTSAISTALDRCSEGDLLLVMGAGDVGDRLDDVLSLRRAEAS